MRITTGPRATRHLAHAALLILAREPTWLGVAKGTLVLAVL
jgi:hypothetical protein